MPAWKILGARPWADYSRRADLRNGMFLYPFSPLHSHALYAPRFGELSPEGRAAISAAQKKRWAAIKKEKAGRE
jgi:hypothetical protein